MVQNKFHLTYSVKKTKKLRGVNIYQIEHIAELKVTGNGYVMNDNSTRSNNHVVFRITQVLLHGKDITSFLPAFDDLSGIEDACRRKIIQLSQNTKDKKFELKPKLVNFKSCAKAK